MKQIAILVATFALVMALLFSGCISSGGIITPPQASQNLKSFNSWDEISSFLSSANSYGGYGYGLEKAIPLMAGAPQAAAEDSSRATDYSQTNIQVEGVDEADIVKNDGKHIYVASNSQPAYYYGSYRPSGKVTIIDAYPPSQMKTVSEIEIEGEVRELVIYKDKLVVFGSEYRQEEQPPSPPSGERIAAPSMIYPPYYQQNYAFLRVYDVSDRSEPVLEKEIASRGSYFQSRMIGGKVYAVFQDYPRYDYPMPLLEVDGEKRTIAPSDVSYFDYPDANYNYNIFTSLDLNDLAREETRRIVLMGSSQNLYVSKENMYVTYARYDYYPILWPAYEKVYGPLLPASAKAEIAKIDLKNISDWRKDRLKSLEVSSYIQNESSPLSYEERSSLQERVYRELETLRQPEASPEKTVINKISLSGFGLIATGEVPGHILNQFSMDEHEGNFRIATTAGRLTRMARPIGAPDTISNNLYVLDSSLKTVGRLEDLAPGESIYSARFMGNRAYLVTFKKIDPFFVLDLSSPSNPRVLGKLKIPGYSDYLHPYDENYVIGLGKGAVAAEEGDFAWYQGVKLSLFDVRDLSNPKEVAKYEIGDRGTDSYALHDHKAFLFSRERNLLVIPIQLAIIDESKYPAGVEANTYGDFVFQGAYVFDISPQSGFVLRGRVTHATEDDFLRSGEYFQSYASVMRSLYMGDYLYTISDRYVKANGLGTLEEIARLDLRDYNPGEEGIQYVSRDPSICASIKFFCADGKIGFEDETGCGCKPA